MINDESINGTTFDAKAYENKLTCNNHNSKTDSQATSFNRNKVLEIKPKTIETDLSRVDSPNYPDTTETLDYIAIKMGLNQNNNNKPDYMVTKPCNVHDSKTIAETVSVINEKPDNDSEPQKLQEHHKKTNLMTKILRRLSRPSIFSKDKKLKKSKTKEKPSSDSNRPSLSSDIKSHTISETINKTPSRSKSFKKIFSRFGHGKSKPAKTGQVLSDATSSIDSRPSVSSAVNTAIIGDRVNSCNDVYVDKLCKEDVEKYNSSSVDCILKDQIGSSNSPDTEVVTRIDDDKLSPLIVNPNLASWSVDGDRPCHSAMSTHFSETSSNVKLTLSLHGYSAYGLSSSRFNSKSCMEFRASNISPKSKISMDNITMFTAKVPSSNSIVPVDDASIVAEQNDTKMDNKDLTVHLEDEISLTIVPEDMRRYSKEEEVPTDVVDVALRKSCRPMEIQLRRSRMTSQTSMARSSLIMVAVAHNSPRTKGASNSASTPICSPDSPGFPGKKLDFEEEINKAIEEEKSDRVEAERNGNDFICIANQYESELNKKIEIVQQYLECSREKMDDDVIGELSTSVGLAKLLLSEKFVQFRTLCDKNLRETENGEFQTLVCDLEGYLMTLEIQIANLNKKFQSVENIRENGWRMPPTTPSLDSAKKKCRPKTPRSTPADNQRSQEARKRIAQFKKMSAATTQQDNSSNLLIIH